MGVIRGQKEYLTWKQKGKLTTKKAILANCYVCNGFEESAEDCEGEDSCPLYRFSPSGRRLSANR